MAKLAAERGLDQTGFAGLVDDLLQKGLLVSEGGATAFKGGFGSLQTQHPMVRDTVRVMAYRAAIAAHAPGRSVVEIGCGTGILSLFAAQAGARRVVAIDETAIAGLAREMVRANGFEGVVEVVSGNSRSVELDEPAELLIHEILGRDPLSESLVPSILDARERLLAKGGRLLPGRLEILCVGVQADEPRPAFCRGRALEEGRELAALYGLDLSPYLQALAEEPEPRRRHWVEQPEFPYPVLSGELGLYDLDLAGDLARVGQPVEAELEIRSAGELTSVLTYFRAHLDERIRLTTSPFAPKTSWGWTVRDLSRRVAVKPGDRVALRARVERQRLRVDLA